MKLYLPKSLLLFGWSFKKYVESLLVSLVVSVKGYVEGKISFLACTDTNWSPLGRSMDLNGFVIAYKYHGIILGSIEASIILLLLLT